MVHLPQELVDAIVDRVGHTDARHRTIDYRTLQVCALTARTFLAPSQRYLFRSFTMKTQNMKDVFTGFIHNPTLASYVRDFYLYICSKDLHFIHSESSSQLLVSFFPLLIGLDRLVIDCWASRNPDWNLFPATSRAAFQALFSLPTLRRFGMNYCPKVPVSILRHAVASYEELSLTDVSIAEDSPFSPFMAEGTSLHDTPVLRRLILDPPEDKLKSFLLSPECATFLTNLRRLELHKLGLGPVSGFKDIALSCSGSIQHLVLDYNWRLEDGIHPLPAMPQIRVLTFIYCMRTLHIPNSLQSTVRGLPTSMPGLKVVNITLDSYLFGSEELIRADMDEALKNLPHLQEIRLIIACPHKESDIEDVFRKALPVANGAGLLSFEIHDGNGLASRVENLYNFLD